MITSTQPHRLTLNAAGNRSIALTDAAKAGEPAAEDSIDSGGPDKKHQLSTFGAHFVEVGVDAANAIYNATGVRVRDDTITLKKLLEKMPDVG